MFSQFSIGLAAAAVLACVCGGALLRTEQRTTKQYLAAGALFASLMYAAAQTALAGIRTVPVHPAWAEYVMQTVACVCAPMVYLLACLYLARVVRDPRLMGRRMLLPVIPAAVSAAVCVGGLVWALLGAGANAIRPFELAAPVTCLLYQAALLGALCIPSVRRALTVLECCGIALLSVCGAAAAAFCLSGFGLAALSLGAACGGVLFRTFTWSPTAAVVPGTRLYSRSAFEAVVHSFYEENRPFTCTALVLPQLTLVEQSSSPEAMRALLCRLSGVFRHAARRSGVYCLDTTVFAVFDRGSERREQMMAELETRFEQPWQDCGRLGLHFVKVYAPQDCVDEAGFVRVLTELCTRASCAGSPMLVSCDDAMQSLAERRRLVAAAFEQALASGEIEIVFQPVYTPRVHRVTAAQAYARLTHAELGEITDEELRIAAREAHEEIRFGDLIFDRLCSALAESGLREAGVETIYVALSPLQWLRSGLADTLAEIARSHGQEMKRFVFEAPEQSVSGGGGEYAANADKLFAFGAQTALSGFGAGESNLMRVLALDARTVKFSPQLVWAYCRGETTIPDYLAPLFTAKGKRLVASGVETKRHADAMTRLGCAELQGDYYARPMSARDLVSYVSSATSAWEHFVREHGIPPESEAAEKAGQA